MILKFYNMQQNRQKTNSVEKALAILLSFTPHNEEMGTVEISNKLGLHKATVSRNLNILTKYGFLQRDPQTRKFRLGQSSINLGLAVNQSVNNNIVHIAKPYIDNLRNTLEETTVLEVLSGGNVIIAYIAEGPGPIRIKGNVGSTRPVYAAAGAKAILAFSPSEIRERFLNEKITRLTPNTITDLEILKEQLQEIRTEGFAFDNEEVNIGINAVGAPIFNHKERPVAAVVVAGLSQAITWEDPSSIVTRLKEAAAKISAQLYYKVEPQGAGRKTG